MEDQRSFASTLRRRVPHMALLMLGAGGSEVLRAMPLMLEDAHGAATIAVTVCSILFANFAEAAILITAITAVERTAFARRRRGIALALTVLAVAPLATLAMMAMTLHTFIPTWTENNIPALYMYLLWMSLAVGSLAAAYYTVWERGEASALRLRHAELERQGIEHRVVESRLNVMKARVEPDFLFRSLGDVQRLYARDVDAAERRLEDLIAYLRAALPQMRGGASTLGDEVHLASTYLRLHEDAFAGRLAVAIELDEAVREAHFPPMALLPLVDDALRRALAESTPRLALALRASTTRERLAVDVEDDCRVQRHESAGEPALVAQAHAFAEFFGAGAAVLRGPGGRGGTCVTLEIEYGVGARDPR